MNRLRRTAAALAVGVVASAGVTHAADLPAAVRTATTLDPQQQAAIGKYVKTQVDLVAARDTKAASTAREELCRQAEQNTIVTPSGVFLSQYLKAVDTHVDVLLKDKTVAGVPHRLNAAIIVARLTIATKLTQLHDKTLLIVADDAPAVSLWGIKSAGAMLPSYLSLPAQRVNQGQKTVDAIVTAGKKHVSTGPLVQTAYDQLDLNDLRLPNEAFLMSVDGINAILEARIDRYLTGVPDFPQADRVPPVFFVKAPVLKAVAANKAKQLAIVQNLVNLLSVSVQYLSNLPQGDKGLQVTGLMSNSAGALGVWFESQNQAAVAAKFKVLSTMRQPTAAKAQQPLDDAVAAVKALADYKALKDAPKIK